MTSIMNIIGSGRAQAGAMLQGLMSQLSSGSGMEDLPPEALQKIAEMSQQAETLSEQKAEALKALEDGKAADLRKEVNDAIEAEFPGKMEEIKATAFQGLLSEIPPETAAMMDRIEKIQEGFKDRIEAIETEHAALEKKYDDQIEALQDSIGMIVAGEMGKVLFKATAGPYLEKAIGVKSIALGFLADNRESIGGLLGVFHELALEVKEGTQDARMKLVDLKSREQRIELTALEEAFGSELAEVIFLSKMNAIQVTDPASLPGAMAPRS
ncbi:hypothetical protein HOA55_04575 [archaeon]|jgi:hypothetical protein|nr:hypothetical protein [archaeon]MBT6820604.1 hypothetical protein [archaeon]MBT7024986.1 hypothetical protein [archaeon]MBT7238605.1 hypothetical protein [archaeon]MBT7914261.1 hypothetical protein [Candidatus Bathyarchaeota archaeon]